MNDLHAMDTLHEQIALVMVLYCIDYSDSNTPTNGILDILFMILVCEVNHISELQDILLYAF